MNIPAAATHPSSSLLGVAQEMLAALQAQEQSGNTAGTFAQAVESARGTADPLALGTLGQTSSSDPTSSVLFQAHAGSLGASLGLAGSGESMLGLDRLAQLKVTGIEASAAMGPFTNGQPPPAGNVQPDIEAAAAVTASGGTGEFGGVYGALLGEKPPLGTRLDVKA